MVTFLPFEGLTPVLKDNETIECRVSPPYDVIGDDYLKELQSKRCNVTRFTLMPEDGRYHKSRKEFDDCIKSGDLEKNSKSFYLYKQTFSDNGVKKTRTGIAGILKTEKYECGNIIPHEETFSKVKADRLNLLRDMETHLESIFGIFQGFNDELNSKIEKNAVPMFEFIDEDGVEHKYMRVSDDETINAMTDALKEQKMLIADGHHRYETALNYALENPNDEKKQYVLATLVSADDPGLVIWPTHRLIDGEDIGENGAIKKLQKSLILKEVEQDEMISYLKNHKLALLFKSGKCFLADYQTNDENMLWTLDTYIAQEIIINGVYKADEGKSKVSYDAEIDSVIEKMASKKHDLAIILNDPSLQDIWDLSMIGKRMPKKTTYFFPKIWSGFVFYSMH